MPCFLPAAGSAVLRHRPLLAQLGGEDDDDAYLEELEGQQGIAYRPLVWSTLGRGSPQMVTSPPGFVETRKNSLHLALKLLKHV